MRFARVSSSGAIVPCVVDENGVLRDVSALVPDISPTTIETIVSSISSADLSSLPVVESDDLSFEAPISQPNNIYCIGLNYSDHAAEAGMEIPSEPILFNKSSVTFCRPDGPIFYSEQMSKLDWEVELGIVIGKKALGISKEAALDHILGFVLVNDISERAWQLEREGQWAKGKSFPNFCPTGPWIVTGDEIENGKNLKMWLDVNGVRMQSGSTSTMVFDPATIVSYLSEFTQLLPGDLICTGTPPGVGAGMTPPVYLKPGDEVALGIEGLGKQKQKVVMFGDQ